MKWVEHVTRMGEMRDAYKVLDVNPERKGTVGKPTWKCEEDIVKMSILMCGLFRGMV
jgi:hypothetical protein